VYYRLPIENGEIVHPDCIDKDEIERIQKEALEKSEAQAADIVAAAEKQAAALAEEALEIAIHIDADTAEKVHRWLECIAFKE